MTYDYLIENVKEASTGKDEDGNTIAIYPSGKDENGNPIIQVDTYLPNGYICSNRYHEDSTVEEIFTHEESEE